MNIKLNIIKLMILLKFPRSLFIIKAVFLSHLVGFTGLEKKEGEKKRKKKQKKNLRNLKKSRLGIFVGLF